MVTTDHPMTVLEFEMLVEQHGGPLKCEYLHANAAFGWQPITSHGVYRLILIRIRSGTYTMCGVRKKSERLRIRRAW